MSLIDFHFSTGEFFGWTLLAFSIWGDWWHVVSPSWPHCRQEDAVEQLFTSYDTQYFETKHSTSQAHFFRLVHWCHNIWSFGLLDPWWAHGYLHCLFFSLLVNIWTLSWFICGSPNNGESHSNCISLCKVFDVIHINIILPWMKSRIKQFHGGWISSYVRGASEVANVPAKQGVD